MQKIGKTMIWILTLMMFTVTVGCKQAPVEDDPNQQKQIVESAKGFMQALFDADVEGLIERTSFPFYADGKLFKEAEEMRMILKREMRKDKFEGVTITQAKFMTIEDVKEEDEVDFDELEEEDVDLEGEIFKKVYRYKRLSETLPWSLQDVWVMKKSNRSVELVEENQQLKNRTDQSHNALIESAKKQVASELAVAEESYRKAYDSGETEAILKAQQALNTAQIRADKVNNLKPKAVEEAEETSLQSTSNQVQRQQSEPQPEAPVRDEKAEAWRDDNPWFGSDDEMTAFALGLHTKLTKEGIDPRSDEYYERINSRMRQVFSDQFDDGIEDAPEETPKTKSSTVVTPATRSTSPKSIRLSKSQVAIANKLGVPLAEYAKQQAALMRKQNG